MPACCRILRFNHYKITTKYSLGILAIYSVQCFQLMMHRDFLAASTYHLTSVAPCISVYINGGGRVSRPSGRGLHFTMALQGGSRANAQSGRALQCSSTTVPLLQHLLDVSCYAELNASAGWCSGHGTN